MKLFFVNADYMIYGDPPLGIAHLASYVLKNHKDVKVKILDQIPSEEIVSIISAEKPDIVGLSATTDNYYKVEELAKEIKKGSPTSIIILGGVHITICPDFFKNSPFDLAVRGEGEIPLFQLIKSLKSNKFLNVNELSKLPGFLLRNSEDVINTGLSTQVEDLDSLPMPARNLLNMSFYRLPRFSSNNLDPIGSLITSRGCPYSCKFCSSSSFWGRRIRFFSAQRVAEEVEVLHKKYNYKYIYIYDDLFSINKERLKKIVEELRRRKLLGKVTFSVLGRANCFDEETARLLKEMNVADITFGFETGNQRMLSYLKGPGITVEHGVNAIKLCRKYGMQPGGFFMVGSPTETLSEMKDTYNFINDNIKDCFILYRTVAFPKTEIWNYAVENKLIDPVTYLIREKSSLKTELDILLSKDVSREEFRDMFFKIKNISGDKKAYALKKILKIRVRHIKGMLNRAFFRKAMILRDDFFEKFNFK